MTSEAKRTKLSENNTAKTSAMPVSGETINLTTLPDLVIFRILSYLPYFPDVFCNVSRVCKKLQRCCDDPLLPKQLALNNAMLLRPTSYEKLLKIAKRTKCLKHLNLCCDDLSYRCTRSGKLPQINIGKLLQIIGNNSRGLVSLAVTDLYGSFLIDEKFQNSLIDIASKGTLEVLRLRITSISKNTLIQVLMMVKHCLTAFEIDDNDFLLAQEDVFQLLSDCEHLEELIIHLKIKVDLKACDAMPDLKRLKRLTLSAKENSRCFVEDLPTGFMSQLESIRLINYTLDDDSFANILKNCKNLKVIEVSLNGIDTYTVLDNLIELKCLEELVLTDVDIKCLSVCGMTTISKLPKLKRLNLCQRKIGWRTSECAFHQRSIIRAFALGALENLISLHLNIRPLNDMCMKAIAEKCLLLEVLKIENSKYVTDDGLVYLAMGCVRLRDVSLDWCKHVGDVGIQALTEKCKNLETLSIRFTNVSEAFCQNPPTKLGIICSHGGIDLSTGLDYGEDEYDEDSYSFKDFRYRR